MPGGDPTTMGTVWMDEPIITLTGTRVALGPLHAGLLPLIARWDNDPWTAEFGITIGDPAERGHGYGTEATRLLCGWAFAELGVHNIWLDTVSTNPAPIRACAEAGFREIGRIRQARRIGVVADLVLMECLASEFAESRGRGEAAIPGRWHDGPSSQRVGDGIEWDGAPRASPPRDRLCRSPG